jgi:acyl-CoA thioester hydrolase
MNVGYYSVAFDKATDALLDHLGIGEAYRFRSNASMFIVEAHVTYDREVGLDDTLRFETQVLGSDEKRLHFFHAMYHDDQAYLAATTELMGLHVDLRTRRTAAFPEGVRDEITAMVDRQAAMGRPKQCGRIMGIRRKSRP